MDKTEVCSGALVPKHVAIIMDGNSRWAKRRFLPSVAGHKEGIDSVRAVIEVCLESKVQILTLFAFSSENWSRPYAEVSALMDIFLGVLRSEVKALNKKKICLRIIGERSRFSRALQDAISDAERVTSESEEFILQIAADYGGQWDIIRAIRKLAAKVQEGTINPKDIDANLLEANLTTGNLPLPDLCIRTGGEYRISNFLLWQLAYSEFYFSELFWPDFKHTAMRNALYEFANRQRRFGRTSKQIEDGVQR